MKRILLATMILLLVCGMVFAQQAGGPPTSSQTKQTAQQLSTQAKTNASQFDTTLADLFARNTSNKDAETFNRLRNEITRLENSISAEQTRIRELLDNGRRLSPELLERVQRLMDQHKAKVAELDAFIAA